ANAGIPVLLKEVDAAALERGLATIRRNYETSVSKGKMTPATLERTLALITPTTTYDGFDAADVVVEAVFENMELKQATFAELGRVTRPDCVLASNSSTLDIDEFARASGRPAQVLGHHFFSPANVMKLLEIVRGRDTARETIATSLKLAKRLGKVGVVVGNCFGFVANRMLAYYMREAYLLLEEGASVPQIDKALTDFGMPVGPFGMQDIDGIDCYGFGCPRHRGGPMFYADTVGLPVVLSRVHEYRRRFGDYWEPAPLLEELVAEGRGFYTEAEPARQA